jgi:hypothetical protein
LITSPILADQVLGRVDRRIAGACEKEKLTYTRYVDDITISGPFNLERSGFPSLVERILREDGFLVNPKKQTFGRLTEDMSITSLREVSGHLDVRKEYVDEVNRQIDDVIALARGDTFAGPYYTRSQILGKVRFVCWVNPGRRRQLIRKFRSVRWSLVRAKARELGLEATRKRLTAIGKPAQRDEGGEQRTQTPR